MAVQTGEENRFITGKNIGTPETDTRVFVVATLDVKSFSVLQVNTDVSFLSIENRTKYSSTRDIQIISLLPLGVNNLGD